MLKTEMLQKFPFFKINLNVLMNIRCIFTEKYLKSSTYTTYSIATAKDRSSLLRFKVLLKAIIFIQFVIGIQTFLYN